MKQGRNDSCSCGSGLKYKKCCGAGATAPPAHQRARLADELSHAIDLHLQGKLEEAATAYHKILEIRPDHGDALHLAGVVESQRGNHTRAIELIRKSIPLLPGMVEPHINLGAAYIDNDQLDEALDCLNRALAMDPSNQQAYVNLGKLYTEKLDLAKALTCYRQVLDAAPNNPVVHSNILFLLHYDPDQTAASLHEAHREWSDRMGRMVKTYSGYKNSRDPERVLNIGYVSPDFGRHPVGLFMLPLLKNHDRHQVKVFCYSNRSKEDAVTAQIKQHADEWRAISRDNDQEVVWQIRNDGIDILVDLAGHSAGNRLPVFAMKPAPLQVAWLGYIGTTGLSTIDYRFTDGVADPPGDNDRYSSEKLMRLPHGFHCYEPPETDIPVTPAPAVKNGTVTFGSFNNLAKMNGQVIDLWARALQSVPGSRLILKTRQLANAAVRAQITDQFCRAGIDRERLELRPATATLEDHLRTYGEIDIVFDPFPYNGVTTTFEALWMGVPVLTIAGGHHVSRLASSILSALDLHELIAAGPEEFLDKSIQLASDLPRLTELRNNLRQRLVSSPFCDAGGFARTIETAYREIWTGWCDHS